MTAADFAKIKAAFPHLRWREGRDSDAEARMGRYLIEIDACDWDAKTFDFQVIFAGKYDSDFVLAACTPCSLGRCLRSLRCTLRRQAETLDAMAAEAKP